MYASSLGARQAKDQGVTTGAEEEGGGNDDAAETAAVVAAAAVMRSLGSELDDSSDSTPTSSEYSPPREREYIRKSIDGSGDKDGGNGGTNGAATGGVADGADAPLFRALALEDDAPPLQMKLRHSVRKGKLDERTALQAVKFVDNQLTKLVASITKHGTAGAGVDGKLGVRYGALAEAVVDDFESLEGLLRTAKNQGVVSYPVPMLLRGTHDDEVITLQSSSIPEANLDTYTFNQLREVSCPVRAFRQKFTLGGCHWIPRMFA
jgi:hypothetical protein